MSGQKTTLLDWWLRYLKLGWPVFPLAPRSKLPLIPKDQGGRGCLDATLNESTVRGWYDRYSQANIGLATGHTFFVLDVDLGKGGEDSFEYLIHQHGVFPDTIQQVTGGGGKQLLFLTPDFQVHGSVAKLAPGLDIRGVGNYVVAPPSIHPVTGRRYEWDGLDLIEDQQIAPAPAWLLDWLRNDGKVQQSHGDRPRPQKLAEQISQGGRNAALFKVACSLRGKGFSEEEILAMLQATNQQRCSPPLPESELRTIAASAARRYQPDARGNLFPVPQVAAPASSPPSGDLPLTSADVEAAIDEAIGRNDLVAAIRLAPEVAKLRKVTRAVIVAKLKLHFKRDFPAREFERAIQEEAGDGGDKPPAPPGGGGEEDGEDDGPNLRFQPRTDAGNGERIVRMHGRDIRYCVEMKKWLVWDGKRWAPDDFGVVRQKAKEMARELYKQSAGLVDLDKHARASESYASISNALGCAASERGIPISTSDLDQHPFLLNCPNGVVDLRDGKLLPHNRDFLLTKLCPVPYDPKAECPRFQVFIEWAMGANPEAELSGHTVRLVGFLQRAFGYSLTSDVTEKVLFVFYGDKGNNGKTTLLTLFRHLLGKDYSAQIAIETVMAAKSQDATMRADLADLRGARFVVTSEVEKEHRLNTAKIKFITAGLSEIKACRKYENPIEFAATHKLFMDCNHRPRVTDADDAIWSRLKLVPFEVKIPDEERDLKLPDKLRAELPGILAWAVRGCMAWQKEGLGVPPEVSAASQEWREHDDPLKEFLEDYCELVEGAYIRTADLVGGYEYWCRQNNEKHPLGREGFADRLYAKKFKQSRSHRIDGKQARTWEGIQLKAEIVTAMKTRAAPRGGWLKDE